MTNGTHQQMATALRAIGLENSFRELHHFSSPAFTSKPISLGRFVGYCDRKSDFKQNGENPQTIRRVNAFITHLKTGNTHEVALATAWREFPLTTK